jgi:glutathione S-transferase
LAGLRYAFPQAMTRLSSNFPRISNLHDRVVARPRLAAHLKSPRREQGIFRHYPELDTATPE